MGTAQVFRLGERGHQSIPTSFLIRSAVASPISKLLDQLASSGDLHPLAPGDTAEIRFERLLEPLLSDLEAGDDQQRVLLFGFIFLGVGRPDIAEQVSDCRAVRIIARVTPCRLHSGKLRQPDGDGGILIVGHVFGDLHRLEPTRFLQLAPNPLDIIISKREQPGEFGNDVAIFFELSVYENWIQRPFGEVTREMRKSLSRVIVVLFPNRSCMVDNPVVDECTPNMSPKSTLIPN